MKTKLTKAKSSSITVGLTYDIASDYTLTAGDPPDKYSEFDNVTIVRGIKKSLERCGYTVYDIGNFSNLLKHVDAVKQHVNIIFNTAEGLQGRNREAQIPLVLEYFGIPYVGSDALTMSLTLDKVITKEILAAHGIPTPKFFVATKPMKRDDMPDLPFPLIVKPQWEGSSKGMTAKSKVKNFNELNDQINHITSLYDQPALVEEFIEGRECTVAVIGNGDTIQAYPIVEILIRNKPVNDKIYVGRYVYSSDVHYCCPADLRPALADLIRDFAIKTYTAVGSRDFGRIDFRVDKNNKPYVLEINPLPALSKQDAFGTIAKTLSMSYTDIIERILKEALVRYHTQL
ncbi:MAG TPA: ATP-grasp domain-containing protein [Patescibacteria group bacterium]|nr:ATP-grasp domain-containing protein [Patescibacteria group bacterium]